MIDDDVLVHDVLAHVFLRSRTRRGLSPILVPAGLLLLPCGTAEGLDKVRDELLDALGRRIAYLRLAVAMQFAGVALAWIGVVLSHGRAVTIGGICLALAGSLLNLTRNDRLHSVDLEIERQWRTFSGGLLELARLRMAISPYSFAESAASGRSVQVILRSRRQELGGEVVAALLPLTEAGIGSREFASQEWLSQRVEELARVDAAGRESARSIARGFDALHATLLAITLVISIMTIARVVPQAALASAALVIILASRPGHLSAAQLLPGDKREPIAAWVAGQGDIPAATELLADDLGSLFRSEVAVVRRVWQR
jgi:hypothetical protein